MKYEYHFLSLKSEYTIKGAIAQIERKEGKLTCESIPSENPYIKKQKFLQHNLNSGCKHVTDNKLQVYYRQCHLPCIRSFHRLSIHFENHIHLSLLSIYSSVILSSSQ